MQLNPTTWRYITYQISNPQDIGTAYYPQVIVKNTKTLVSLFTINLVNQGGGLYTGSYQLPTDSTGNGYQLVELLTVYTDSGHSIMSPNYEITAEVVDVNYIQSAVSSIGTGGEYQDLTDYDKIGGLLGEALKKIPKNEYSDKELKKLINQLLEEHNIHHQQIMLGFEDRRQHTEKNHKELLKHLGGIGESVNKIPLTELVAGLHGRLDNLEKKFVELTYAQTQILNSKQELTDTHTKTMEELREEFKQQIGATKKELADTIGDYFASVDTMTVTKGVPRYERKEDPMERYNNLAKGLI